MLNAPFCVPRVVGVELLASIFLACRPDLHLVVVREVTFAGDVGEEVRDVGKSRALGANAAVERNVGREGRHDRQGGARKQRIKWYGTKDSTITMDGHRLAEKGAAEVGEEGKQEEMRGKTLNRRSCHPSGVAASAVG